MEKFQKVVIVEARKYDGPRLTVVHDQLGDQTANAGDYLAGNERGKIEVIAAAKFEAEYVPCAEAGVDPDKALAVLQSELEAANEQIGQLDLALDAEKQKAAELEGELASVTDKVQALEAKLAPPVTS
jgi:septal ring factor EnvC (AmiA/AmiB activator)